MGRYTNQYVEKNCTMWYNKIKINKEAMTYGEVI